MPKLVYQTAAVSVAQFITLMILGIPNSIVSIVSTCHSDNSNCVSNMIVTIILYLLTALWFGLIVLIAYGAQKKRSRQLAVILGGLEFVTLIVAGYIDFPHDGNILSKFTSALDAIISIWIIYLAFRLFISGDKRIVKRRSVLSRAKQRH